MAISHVDTVTNNSTTASTTSAVTMPSFSEDDIVFVILAPTATFTITAGVYSAPAGWTEVPGIIGGVAQDTFSGIRLQCFYRIMQAGDPGSVNFTNSIASGFKAIASAYSGVDLADPINIAASNSGSGSTSAVCPSVTTDADNTFLLRIAACDSNQTLTNASVNVRNNTGGIGTPGNGLNSATGDETQALAGATGTSTWTIGAAEQWVSLTIAFNDAGIGANFVGSGSSTGTSFSLDVGTADTNRLVVVVAGDESTGTNLSGVTVDGKACTLVAISDNPAGLGNHQEMWYINESGLGASAGSVTVAISGGDADWAVHAILYTNVSQNAPVDTEINNTIETGPDITVTSVNCPANGLVVAGFGQGQSGLTQSSITAPLVQRETAAPSSADLFTYSGTESSEQTNKTYTLTWSATFNRGTGIVATWDGFVEKKQTHQMIL
jgi:hypothetical protein